jgi:hypothetical protein
MTFRATNLRKLPLIRFLKLGRKGAWGMAHHPHFGCPVNCPNCPREITIDIDPRLKGMRRLEKILHESGHLAAIGLDEEIVRRMAMYQARVADHLGYTADEEEHVENYGV